MRLQLKNDHPPSQPPSALDGIKMATTPASEGLFGRCVSYLRNTVSVIRTQITLDKIGQISIAASVALGASVAFKGSDLGAKLDGLAIAAYGSALACGLMGMGAALKGQRAKAGKCMLLGAAIAGISQQVMSTHKNQRHNASVCLSQNAQLRSENVNLHYRNTRLASKNARLKAKFADTTSKLAAAKAKLSDFQSKNIFQRFWPNDIPTDEKTKTDPPRTPPLKNNKVPAGKVKHGRRIVFGSTYIAENNPERQALAKLVDDNHKEYAERWGLTHRVVSENLLKGQCATTSDSIHSTKDCVPYWNKVAVLREWLNKPAAQSKIEDWYVLADDDMPVTNMKVDPFAAIDILRRGEDTSVIVARDVISWTGKEYDSVNTGLFFVRKDEASRKLIEKLWEKRNDYATYKDHCRTLGTCINQDVLHEQEGLARLIREDSSLLDRVMTVVKPRDTYGTTELALNTFSREGCFVRKQNGWKEEKISYNDPKEGIWRPGDWMGQTAGVPTWGWHCADKANGKPPGALRKDKLKIMIDQTVR